MIIGIVAIAKNGVIGKDNSLPWNIPEDLKEFKKLTLNKTIVMGRRTFDSIGRILPSRRNIILTKNSSLKIEGAETMALDSKEFYDLLNQKETIFIIGGKQIFNELKDKINIWVVSWIRDEHQGDVILNYEQLLLGFKEYKKIDFENFVQIFYKRENEF